MNEHNAYQFKHIEMSEVSLRIAIAGNEYPLRVKEEDAENVRLAAEMINGKISEFEQNYAVKEKKDVLAMVMLQLVTELIQQGKSKSEELKQLKNVLDELNQMVRDHQKRINN